MPVCRCSICVNRLFLYSRRDMKVQTQKYSSSNSWFIKLGSYVLIGVMIFVSDSLKAWATIPGRSYHLLQDVLLPWPVHHPILPVHFCDRSCCISSVWRQWFSGYDFTIDIGNRQVLLASGKLRSAFCMAGKCFSFTTQLRFSVLPGLLR